MIVIKAYVRSQCQTIAKGARSYPMNEQPIGAEGKIITGTIECIEKYGISGATNRRIAEVAGVNIAAINYYFRSKEILIQRVMEITLKNAFDLSDFPPMPGASVQERCAAIFLEILQGGFQYPNLTRAHFYNLLAEGQPDATLQQYVNRFIDDLAKDLEDRGTKLPAKELKLALIEIFSCVLMAILAPSLFERQPGMDTHNPSSRAEFISRLVERLLPDQ
jgi:TetR/AcrR family transcriptional regulator, regulator of cefoperazone and chloramphenicol sensitivity